MIRIFRYKAGANFLFLNNFWKRSYGYHWNDGGLFQTLITSTHHFYWSFKSICELISVHDNELWNSEILLQSEKSLSEWCTVFKPNLTITFTKAQPGKRLKLEIKFCLSGKPMKYQKRLTVIAVQSR